MGDNELILSEFDALKHMIDHGVKLIGCYDSGAAIASGEEYKDAFTSGITEIQNLMQGNGDKHGHARGQIIRLFRFIPADAGFVCIDIDRGHANDLCKGSIHMRRNISPVG